MGIGLGKEFDAAGFGEGLETVEDFGSVAFELLDGHAGDGERHLEGSVMAEDQVVQHLVGRQVAALCDTAHDGPVGEIVEIVVVIADVEEAELTQTVGLMDLEVETN